MYTGLAVRKANTMLSLLREKDASALFIGKKQQRSAFAGDYRGWT